MGLGIYTTASPSTRYSSDGSLSNPVHPMIDGRTGGSVEQILYVHNDDATMTYSGIQAFPVCTSGLDIANGNLGYSIKLHTGSTRPTVDQWTAITPGSTINLGTLGTSVTADTSTYLPFWMQVNVPRNAQIATYTDLKLSISASGFLV